MSRCPKDNSFSTSTQASPGSIPSSYASLPIQGIIAPKIDIEPNDTSSFDSEPVAGFAMDSVGSESLAENCVALLLGPGKACGGVGTGTTTDEVAAASWRSRMKRQVNITMKLHIHIDVGIVSSRCLERGVYLPGDPLRNKVCQLCEATIQHSASSKPLNIDKCPPQSPLRGRVLPHLRRAGPYTCWLDGILLIAAASSQEI